MTITITDAYTQRGWSPTGHLINDEPIRRMIGRTYHDRGAAMRAARKLADDRGYAALIYTTDDGEVWESGDEPDIVGRTRLHRRVSLA